MEGKVTPLVDVVRLGAIMRLSVGLDNGCLRVSYNQLYQFLRLREMRTKNFIFHGHKYILVFFLVKLLDSVLNK